MGSDKQDILKRIEEVFLDTFSEDFKFSMELDSEDLEEWDSLTHIRLLTAIESEFEVEFDLEEIESLSNVSTIVTVLVSKTN
ncbi:MAG: acyl carrier protein [Methyloprofundus sp.]|nr:acyl carrier protein [Methyloprofundus sp.]